MKRLAVLALAALLLLTAGCAALFDRRVYFDEPYEGPAEVSEPEEDAPDAISNYTALRRAIYRLVSEHIESAELQFQNYDGSIGPDLSTACWEVKSSTALGAFAVDYISYDLSRIVSYYQAEIHITYKRTAYQVEVLENAATMSALGDRLEEALRDGETYLVLEIGAAAAGADTVREDLARAYYADPLLCPVLPAAEAGFYPETGVDRILEITLDYGMDGESLTARREELAAAVDRMRDRTLDGTAPETSPDELLRKLCGYLGELCAFRPEAGTTAWDALAERQASSEGMAMALAAGCEALGLDSRIVSGRLNGEPHVWNIVTLEGSAYHVDVSRWESGEEVFLRGDEALWGAYWWDTSEYPMCPGDYYPPAAPGEPSGEPASGEPSGAVTAAAEAVGAVLGRIGEY